MHIQAHLIPNPTRTQGVRAGLDRLASELRRPWTRTDCANERQLARPVFKAF
jgi:hypothetical protein